MRHFILLIAVLLLGQFLQDCVKASDDNLPDLKKLCIKALKTESFKVENLDDKENWNNILRSLPEEIVLNILEKKSHEQLLVLQELTNDENLEKFTKIWMKKDYILRQHEINDNFINKYKLSIVNALNLTLSDINLYCLGRNTSITSLNIKDCEIPEDGIAFLCEGFKERNNLRVLRLENMFLTDNSEYVQILSASLAHNTALVWLYLPFNNIADNDLVQLVDSLRENHSPLVLDLSNNYIQNGRMESLTRLVNLNLANNQVNSIDILGLRHCNNLNILNLDNNDVDDEGLIEVFHISSLTELDLSENDFSNEGMRGLGQARGINISLTFLEFSKNSLDEEGAEFLSSFPNLKKLNLNNNNIDDIGLRSIAQLSNLINLDLEFNTVTFNTINLQEQGIFASLAHLNLVGNLVNDQGLLAIAQLSRLTNLDLEANNFTTQGIKDFGQRNAQNTSLKILNLCRNYLNGEVGEILPLFLNLRELNLNYNYLSCNNIHAFTYILTHNNSLKFLNLRGNDMNALIMVLQENIIFNNLVLDLDQGEHNEE